MKSFGSLLLFFGVGSIVLNLVGYEFSLLMWIDMWGLATGNMIRIGMIVAGVALFAMGMKGGNGAEEDNFDDIGAPDVKVEAEGDGVQA